MPIAMGGGRMEQGKFLCFFSLFFPIRILGWVEVDRRKEIIGSRGGRQTCTWVDHFGRKKKGNSRMRKIHLHGSIQPNSRCLLLAKSHGCSSHTVKQNPHDHRVGKEPMILEQ